MDDGLLSEILAAEREIRLQIETLEQETAVHLEKLGQELERMVAAETELLETKLVNARARAEQSAEEEAAALLAKTRAFALRQENLSSEQLDRVVQRHLARIYPEGAHDRQNEQA